MRGRNRSTMKTFSNKWENKAIEDDGSYMSRSARSFVTGFKNMLKRELGPEYDVSIKAGHYDLSGFIEHDGMYEYISYSIPRYGNPINFDSSSYMEDVMYRYASGTDDYNGGHNHFSSIRNTPKAIISAFENQKKYGDR